LSKREAWAASFEKLFISRSEPRTDHPKKLASYSNPERQSALFNLQSYPELILHRRDELRQEQMSSPPAADYQKFIVEIAAGLPVNADVEPSEFDKEEANVVTEFDAAMYAKKRLHQFLKK